MEESAKRLETTTAVYDETQHSSQYIGKDFGKPVYIGTNYFLQKTSATTMVQSLLVKDENGANQPNIEFTTKNTYKNLFVMGTTFFFIFSAFTSLQNLQSSIHSDDNLGFASLAVIYVAFSFSCLFVPPLLINKLGYKYTIMMSSIGYVIYTAANFYPRWWTMIPASVINGLCAGPLWASQGSYLTTLAMNYASTSKQNQNVLITKFWAIFCMMLNISQIVGNTISSVILKPSQGRSRKRETLSTKTNVVFSTSLYLSSIFPYTDCVLPYKAIRSPYTGIYGTVFCSISRCAWYTICFVISITVTLNSTYEEFTCGATFCPSSVISPVNHNTKNSTVLILMVIYLICGVFGTISASFLDKLHVTVENKSSMTYFLTVWKSLNDWKIMFLFPISAFKGLEMGFIFADFTKAYVTCSLGIEKVGFIMVSFGIANSITSLSIGLLSKKLNRIFGITVGALLQLGLIIRLLLWQSNGSSVYLFFGIAVIWGVADAIFNTQISAFYGILFPHTKEAAFSTLKLFESIGFVLSFSSGTSLCISVKLSILLVVVILGMILYGIIEYKQRTSNRDDTTTESGNQEELLK